MKKRVVGMRKRIMIRAMSKMINLGNSRHGNPLLSTQDCFPIQISQKHIPFFFSSSTGVVIVTQESCVEPQSSAIINRIESQKYVIAMSLLALHLKYTDCLSIA